MFLNLTSKPEVMETLSLTCGLVFTNVFSEKLVAFFWDNRPVGRALTHSSLEWEV